MNLHDRIYVAGHNGLVGSALVRRLQQLGYTQLLLRSRAELDLTDQAAVHDFFRQERPAYVLLAAAKVGGIWANYSYPADFIRDNLAIVVNVVEASHATGVDKLMCLGSSCVYPKHAPQPLREDYLLTGPLEPTNEPYAVAKIAGIKLCESYHRQFGSRFFSVMPTNLYGPQDKFDPETSHVMPALIRKFVAAAEDGSESVTLWGTGTPRREFMHVDDMADACIHLMSRLSGGEMVNIGVGTDHTIAEVAGMVARAAGFSGEIHWDPSRPDGSPRKLLDVTRLEALDWRASITLEDGIRSTVEWYRREVAPQHAT